MMDAILNCFKAGAEAGAEEEEVKGTEDFLTR
jgi:hypothetical protein